MSTVAYYNGSAASLSPQCIMPHLTSCAGDRHNMPPPLQVDLWPFDIESGVRVTCDMGYLCANFTLSRPLCSWFRPDVCGRQTDVRCASSLNVPYPRGGPGGGTKYTPELITDML